MKYLPSVLEQKSIKEIIIHINRNNNYFLDTFSFNCYLTPS